MGRLTHPPMTADLGAQWRPIETAPERIADEREALIGQLGSDGQWIAVKPWDPAWSRAGMVKLGATHWLRIPPADTPASAESALVETAIAYAHEHIAYGAGGFINSAKQDTAWFKMMQACAAVEHKRRPTTPQDPATGPDGDET